MFGRKSVHFVTKIQPGSDAQATCTCRYYQQRSTGPWYQYQYIFVIEKLLALNSKNPSQQHLDGRIYDK